MKYKETKSLFLKKYQYKVVLVCPAASLFRGGDFDEAHRQLSAYIPNTGRFQSYSWQYRIKTPEDLAISKKLCIDLKSMTDMDVRIESPFVSVYTNNVKDVNALEKKHADIIKYISKPSKTVVLTEDVIVMPKMTDYDFKITLGATKTEHSAFLEWAENNNKIRVTKSCIRDLSRARSWGGTHFYVKGDNNLLMAKMHLSGCIAKIQRIAKE